MAARHNKVDIARRLIELGLDANAKTTRSASVARLAARHNSAHVLELLISHPGFQCVRAHESCKQSRAHAERDRVLTRIVLLALGYDTTSTRSSRILQWTRICNIDPCAQGQMPCDTAAGTTTADRRLSFPTVWLLILVRVVG